MDEQKAKIKKNEFGGTMRLGGYECKLKKGTTAYQAYAKENIVERHRHRYEFNNKYRSQLEKLGLVVSGINEQRNLVEIVELEDHPFFVGVQFHPEFKTRFIKPHPLFARFVKEASKIEPILP